MIKHFSDLEVYRLSYKNAMNIFKLTRNFPKEEIYSLTSQMIRSSRSIPANISEGWAKRKHENLFKKHLLDAIGSCDETKTWLNFACDCSYIDKEIFDEAHKNYESIGAKLFKLHEQWRTYS